jgi:hypothetical protein
MFDGAWLSQYWSRQFLLNHGGLAMRIFTCTALIALLCAGTSVTAAPFPTAVLASSSAAAENTAYTFTTELGGGTGQQFWSFTLPGPGIYLATFAAIFDGQGSAATPAVFTCALTEPNGRAFVQSTTFGEANGGVLFGVSGSGVIDVKKGKLRLGANCGTGDNSPWDFGDQPLEVTFVKLAGQVTGPLVAAAVGGPESGRAR